MLPAVDLAGQEMSAVRRVKPDFFCNFLKAYDNPLDRPPDGLQFIDRGADPFVQEGAIGCRDRALVRNRCQTGAHSDTRRLRVHGALLLKREVPLPEYTFLCAAVLVELA